MKNHDYWPCDEKLSWWTELSAGNSFLVALAASKKRVCAQILSPTRGFHVVRAYTSARYSFAFFPFVSLTGAINCSWPEELAISSGQELSLSARECATGKKRKLSVRWVKKKHRVRAIKERIPHEL
jgi:hypothetical protein